MKTADKYRKQLYDIRSNYPVSKDCVLRGIT